MVILPAQSVAAVFIVNVVVGDMVAEHQYADQMIFATVQLVREDPPLREYLHVLPAVVVVSVNCHLIVIVPL